MSTIAEWNARLSNTYTDTLPESGLELEFRPVSFIDVLGSGGIKSHLTAGFGRLLKKLLGALDVDELKDAASDTGKLLNVIADLLGDTDDLVLSVQMLRAFAKAAIASPTVDVRDPKQPEKLGLDSLPVADLYYIFEQRSGISLAETFLEDTHGLPAPAQSGG